MQRLGGVLDRLCAICPNSSVGWPNVGPKSVLSSRCWANVSPTYNAVWLVRLCRGLPMRVTHATEPARHRVAGLCAVRWCAARLCVIRLGCVEGHPWMCFPWKWFTKHAQLIMGTWPIYKNLQLILTKKPFHLIKYLLATFIFFLSFQSVLVYIVSRYIESL